MRDGTQALTLVAVIGAGMLTSCEATPPPPSAPPAVEFAEVPAEVRMGQTAVTYVLADGGTLEVDMAGYRVLTDHGWEGELVILGSDADGQFVATFVPQGGLPDDCYVENEVGIDRGTHVETRGVLWRKAASFAAAAPVGPDETYPGGTRFCFDSSGEITSTIAR